MIDGAQTASLADRLAALSDEERADLLSPFKGYQLEQLEHDWRLWARPGQMVPPGDWLCWLVLAGRGFGKTRMGAEWVRMKARDPQARIALVAATWAEARAVMVEGQSGLLSISHAAERPLFEPSKQQLSWPSGARGFIYSADQPDQLRGPQHSAAWIDEMAKFSYADTLWDMLGMGLRIGTLPQAMVTTTPRPLALIKQLTKEPSTHVTRGSTWANARNLAPSFLRQMKARYSGTRLGNQELEGQLLEDIDGALWTYKDIEAARLKDPPPLARIVVAIDPPVTSHAGSDACGLIVAGCDESGHGYVLADVSLEQASPDVWARKAVDVYEEFSADRIIAEVNQGGDLVETVLRTQAERIPYKGVRASRGKHVRAEPIAALYEQRRIHHVGVFADLEDQLCSFVPGQASSPDRLDALVWAFTDLLLGPDATPRVRRL